MEISKWEFDEIPIKIGPGILRVGGGQAMFPFKGGNYFAVLFLLQVNLVFAQNPYIREGSVGKPSPDTEASDKNGLRYRPIETWVGQKFIFLPKPKSLQQYGYRASYPGDSRCAYKDCMGRIGTVQEVTPIRYSDSGFHVKIKMNDNGQVYTASALDGQIDDLAAVADLELARSLWMGKALWFFGHEIATYDALTGKIGSLKNVRKYCPVKVMDVVAGWYSFEPARLVVRTESGEEGFVDVNVTGTNVPDSLRDMARFEDSFLTQDPRLTHKWPPEVWSAIEDGRVFVGMTAEQARMGWGSPIEINTTVTEGGKHEQWVYPGRNFIYVENGRVTAAQK